MRWYHLVLLLVLTGCTAAPTTPTPTATPVIPVLEGRITAGEGRRVLACRIEAAETCTITGPTAITNSDGRFAFRALPDGSYYLLVDTGLSPVEGWQGRTLRLTDPTWLRDELLGAPHLNLMPNVSRFDAGVTALGFEGSPLFLAVDETGAAIIANNRDQVTFTPWVYTAINRGEIRERIGPLTEAERDQFAPDVAARWEAFIGGDDSAYLDTDARLIEAVRAGELHPIGDTRFTAIETWEGELVKWLGYQVSQGGQTIIVAWAEEGQIIEAETGYVLDVRDPPGEWITEGPDGEQIWHYGYSYYLLWGRVLPDPIITMIETFYTWGPDHVAFYLEGYQRAVDSFGGDMARITWDAGLRAEIAGYQPEGAATLHLPPSGTVDVSRERFLRAVIDDQVVVDRESVTDYLASPTAAQSPYLPNADPQEVIDALLTPYRSGHLFNDMEAAIILDATYNGEGPLRIVISDRLDAGFVVPRRGDKVIYVSRAEVANVILGYGGTLNARWPHELGHLIEFGDPTYEWPGQPGGVSTCEPLKYMMEFVWWIQRYPGDAPDTDWMPISSGLTLARILSDRYPNSGC